ncbi:hypothetical protein A3J90_06490 [candidate division WOR-1 bacterium RIFOXYC2_FULL_37_10]|uniref:Capsular polysaccharide assembling protein CapF C-terminal domain-containing protein n=1 Tax=candidate division WOR-1 bacterium RIFOXYB2_FULL_37_13 TaxID=1802579 RepID=A0A1F4SQ67_UNCSA|nr:MAG: hypothetical protein A2310_07460 [candidate division WOR-1 bacterium RIFOXYB2_FULL_37_13]OGC33353.1 MAG: hypothetical protein A3J90_06490 [candidate division WOR-1 bacterium RIFOXYC2_FULL_37_10]
MKIFEAYKKNASIRGLFLGIVNFGNWQEVNYIETQAGQIRGGHYHKEAMELFYIIEGNISIKVVDLKGELIKEFLANKGSIFLVEPYEVHTFTCNSDCKWINVMSKKMDNDSCDIYKYEGK